MTKADIKRAEEIFEQLRALLAKNQLVAVFQIVPMERQAIVEAISGAWVEAREAGKVGPS